MSNFKNISQQDQQIYNLILSAKDLGLITDYLEDGNYITCVLDGATYVICFGIDPDKDHPSAERAIRASRFVTRLMDRIRAGYSCYYVQSNNVQPPEDSTLKALLTKMCPSAGITHVKYLRDEDIADTKYYASSYGIEVEIVAMIGEVYKRMVDFLYVEKIGDNFVYKHDDNITPKILSTDGTIDQKQEVDQQAQDILDLILQGKLKNQSPNENTRKENIQAILKALADSAASNFYGFLAEAKQQDVKVGQISVKPCSLLIGANNDKKHVYSVSHGNNSGELALIWRRNLGEINENTPLYLYISNKRFMGLTNIPNEHPLTEDFKSLVLAHMVEGTHPSITLKPNSWTLNKQYENICNHALPVTRNRSKKHVFRCLTENTDGAQRLKAECDECKLTGVLHYAGNLSQEYYLKDGKVQFGRIFKSGTSSFTCDICKKTIYYPSDKGSEKTAYETSHLLLDGHLCCDQCSDIVVIDEKRFKKTEDVHLKDKVGTVYAQVDENDNFVSVDDGGNVFKCSNCGHIVLSKKKNESVVENSLCDICGSHICSSCADNKSQVSRPKVINTGTYACSHCISLSAIRHKRSNKLQKLFTVVDENGADQLVLDNTNAPELIFHCATCKKAKYYDPTKHTRCSCCGKIVCETCVGKVSEDSGDLALTYCSECHSKIAGDTDYEANKRSAEDSFQKLMQHKVKVHRAENCAEKQLTDHFIRNVNKYLPYFSLKERTLIRRAIKDNNVNSTVEIKCCDSAVLDKAVRYKFTVTVNYQCYLFYLVNNKLTFGGII